MKTTLPAGESMNREDLILKIIKYLRSWKNANIDQEPYKGDLFKIFADAFNDGMLTCKDDLNVDRLTRLILDFGEDVVDVSHPYTNWNKFRESWDEWTYAWIHASKRGLRQVS
jgi:hypothetical protein